MTSSATENDMEPTTPQPAPPSLYDRLGGVYNVATVVDDFIDRIMVDPRLNKNPAVDEAHHRVSPPGFKYLVTEMVCWAAGGPQRYSGRPMVESHRHLGIIEDEWAAFLDDLHQTLTKFDVPAQEERDLTAIVESTKDDIVVPAPQQGPRPRCESPARRRRRRALAVRIHSPAALRFFRPRGDVWP